MGPLALFLIAILILNTTAVVAPKVVDNVTKIFTLVKKNYSNAKYLGEVNGREYYLKYIDARILGPICQIYAEGYAEPMPSASELKQDIEKVLDWLNLDFKISIYYEISGSTIRMWISLDAPRALFYYNQYKQWLE